MGIPIAIYNEGVEFIVPLSLEGGVFSRVVLFLSKICISHLTHSLALVMYTCSDSAMLFLSCAYL